MQKYGKKIKRSKNLYKKRKHPARKVLEIVAMVIIVGALGLIGYAAGKPLIEFLTGDRQVDSQDPPWTPPENGENNGENAKENGENGEENGENGNPQNPPQAGTYNAVAAPVTVLDNTASLGAYIQQQKANGFNAVILEMKDSTGHLLYRSEYRPLEALPATADVLRGTLTAEQIFGAFEGTGITPIARLNTTLDSLGSRHLDDVSFVFYQGGSRWLDNTVAAGGKSWANPFLHGTQDYISYLVSELAAAGFPEIILANNVFPEFKAFDIGILNPRFTNQSSRFEGLVELMKACSAAKGDSRLILEMSLKDVVESYAGLNNTAEVLRGRNSLDGFALLINYTAGDFGSELKTGENSSVVLPGGKTERINMLYKQAENQTGGLYVIPGFVSAGLSDSDEEAVVKAFAELGFAGYAKR